MLNLAHLYKVTVSPPYVQDSVIAALARLSDVVYAERNGGWQLHTNDQHYGKQWYLKNTGQSGGTVGTDIKAEDAWQIFTGSSQRKIGIIDAGVKTDHEDLTGKVSGDDPDYNWHDPYWYYSYAHGTHVAGIASARTGNGTGIAGVDQNAQIYSRRIFDSQNHQGDNTYIYNAIVDAVNQGCSVLNNSWGNALYSTTIRMAFAYAYKMNRVAVCSMGNNNGSQTQYPAGFGQGIIAVGSTQDNDVVSTFSDIGNHIDVAAPGGSGTGDVRDIFSTVAYNNATYSGYYDFLAGTSMAAPVVTGIASLLKGYNPNLYNDDIEHIIKLSADKIRPDLYTYDANGWNINVGYGRVNARRALDKLRSPNVLTQASATGGTDVGQTGIFPMYIYGAQGYGLSDGRYYVKQHEVRMTVNFAPMMNHSVWGRGVATNGWADEGNINFALGWCDAVPGTLTGTSVTLRTYVYEVYNILGQSFGWKPAQPSNVTFAYTVLGQSNPLSVYITGPSIGSCTTGTWYANVSGGVPGYSYQWYQEWDCGGSATVSTTSGGIKPLRPCNSWTPVGTNSPTLQYYWCGGNGYLRVDVTDAVGTLVSAQYYVQGAGTPAKMNNENNEMVASSTMLPVTFSIDSYPNPFNPSTTINYDLPVAGEVSLVVCDVLGRKVTELASGLHEAGYHSVIWNASDAASGVYFARFTVTDPEGQVKFTKVSKLMLMK
jgi:hypothetical protein